MSSVNEKKIWFMAIVLCLVLMSVTRADILWLEQDKLTAPDGNDYHHFGYSVSISGDYAVVGAYGDDVNGNYSGSAYIFQRSGNNWNQLDKLTASDGGPGDHFGKVAISGDYAIVGAAYDDPNGMSSGSAYIFQRSGSTWNQIDKLTASDGAQYDRFGCYVSISGDYAIVGAYGDNTYAGSAYIFQRSGSTWNQVAKLTSSDGADYDDFGLSVSISGDYAIAGAYADDPNGNNSGSVYIFEKPGGGWTNATETAKLTASDGNVSDYFGGSVSISGNYAIIGADKDDDHGSSSGSAYIFQRGGSSWTQQAKLTASDAAADDNFGNDVSINGDYALVTAYFDDDKGDSSGSAYIFYRDPGSGWTEQAKLTASDGSASDRFGSSVSISGENVIVGAYWDDPNGTSSGSAYVFRKVLCADWLTADFSGDCFVDFVDFSIFADQWLDCGDPCDPNCQL